MRHQSLIALIANACDSTATGRPLEIDLGWQDCIAHVHISVGPSSILAVGFAPTFCHLDDSHTLLSISAGLQDLSPWEVVRIYGRNLEHRLVGNAFEIRDCELALCIVLNLVPEYIVGLQMCVCVYDVLRLQGL